MQPVASEDSDHVEAKLLEARVSFGEVLLGDEAKFLLLERRDGFGRLAEGSSSAELHFTKDEGFSVAEDQVDLPVAGLEVSLDEGISQALEKAKCDPLSTLAVSAPSFQLPTPA